MGIYKKIDSFLFNKLIKGVCLVLVLYLMSVYIDMDEDFAKTPPQGWNNFDSYGINLNEKAASANIESFAEKLPPNGYEYFVFSTDWFGEYVMTEDT